MRQNLQKISTEERMEIDIFGALLELVPATQTVSERLESVKQASQKLNFRKKAASKKFSHLQR